MAYRRQQEDGHPDGGADFLVVALLRFLARKEAVVGEVELYSQRRFIPLERAQSALDAVAADEARQPLAGFQLRACGPELIDRFRALFLSLVFAFHCRLL